MPDRAPSLRPTYQTKSRYREQTRRPPPEQTAAFLVPPPLASIQALRGESNEELRFVSLRKQQRRPAVPCQGFDPAAPLDGLRRTGADPISVPAGSSALQRRGGHQKPRSRY